MLCASTGRAPAKRNEGATGGIQFTPMAVITVSGQFGSRAEDVAAALAARTGFRLLSAATLRQQVRSRHGVEHPQGSLEAGSGAPGASGEGNGRLSAELSYYADLVTEVVLDYATRENVVLVDAGGQFLFRETPCAFHLRVVAPRAWRSATVAAEMALPPPVAADRTARHDAGQARYFRAVFGASAQNSQLYHLVLNTAALDLDHAIELACDAVDRAMISSAGLLSPGAAERIRLASKLRLARRFADLPGSPLLERVPFAHPSERVFARLMDFYGIEWEYEPRTFPIEWNERGEVSEAFAPDFYLPELDLYVELTTMKQSLVTKKNRKVKRLRELHPDVNIRIFYQKDVEDLVFKLGAPQLTVA